MRHNKLISLKRAKRLGFIYETNHSMEFGRCPYCGCHFSFEIKDIHSHNAYNSTEKDKKRHVACPHCEEDIVVENAENNYLLPIVKVRFEK